MDWEIIMKLMDERIDRLTQAVEKIAINMEYQRCNDIDQIGRLNNANRQLEMLLRQVNERLDNQTECDKVMTHIGGCPDCNRALQ